MMKEFKIIPKYLCIICFFLVLGYYILGYFSSFIGWYGYKKWLYRKFTSNINESKKRGVFVKELQYRTDTHILILKNFRPYIEKGFKYGTHSSEVTEPLEGSSYPYQLCFNYKYSEDTTIFIKENELKKFDSANASWGFLKKMEIKDSIELVVWNKDKPIGTIKVWQ